MRTAPNPAPAPAKAARPLRLLLVEDDPDTAALIQETLEDHFGPECVQHCPTLAQARLEPVKDLDVVLCDMNLPDGSGLELLSELLLHRPDLPVIFVTGEGILDNAMQAIRRGAYDYIIKAGDYLFTIPLMVEKNLAIWRTKQENARLQEQLTRTLDEIRVKNAQLEEAILQLQTMAATDPLTGLCNRRAWALQLDRCYAEAHRYGRDLACIMIDLDGFKLLNDSLGHQRGDELLERTARVLEACCRRSDITGRYGGDEFVVLLPQTDEGTARGVAQRIAEEFDAMFHAVFADAAAPVRVTVSMGMATLGALGAIGSGGDDRPVQGRVASAEQLIAQADHALYRAKQTGRSRLAVYAPQPTAAPLAR